MRLLAAVLMVLASTSTATRAAANPPAPPDCTVSCQTETTTVHAVDDHFGVSQQQRPSDRVPGRGAATDGAAPGKATWTSVDEFMTPICSGNGLQGADRMCVAATTYCQDGRVAFWVWHQVTTYTRQQDSTVTQIPAPWRQEDGAFCLGADDPQVPTIGKVISWVQDHFSTLAITPAAVTAAPAPRTLVNIETRLSAGSAATVDIPTATPWTDVIVHAKPLRWRWYFGDGTQSATLTTPDTTHVYRQARLHQGVRVEVEWGGTFSVAGDATSYPIVGTALVRSAAVALDVREARTQLVSR